MPLIKNSLLFSAVYSLQKKCHDIHNLLIKKKASEAKLICIGFNSHKLSKA